MRTRFAAFFGHPGVMRLALPAAVGRLPDGMLNLALVLVIQAATGSYAVAGAGTAAYAITAGTLSPLWGRAVDRVGFRLIVALTSVGHAIVLAGMFAVAARPDLAALLVVLAAAGGVTRPPLGSVTRTVWSRLLAGDAREVAYTFEAIVVDAVFIAGPALVAALAAVTAPSVALLAAAGAMLAGGLGVVTAPALSVPAASVDIDTGMGRRWLGPLHHGRVVVALLVGMLGLGSIAVVEIAAIGFANQAGSRAASGVLLALLSVGGVAGGIYWASRRQPGTHAVQLVVLLTVLAGMWAALSLSSGIVALGGLLVVAGLVMNPLTAVQFAIVNELAPRRSLTETFGWLTAVVAAGEGLGAVASGVVVDVGPAYGFWLAAAMTATAAAVTYVFFLRYRVRAKGRASGDTS